MGEEVKQELELEELVSLFTSKLEFMELYLGFGFLFGLTWILAWIQVDLSLIMS